MLLPCLSPEMGGGRDSAPGPFVTLVGGRWSVRRCEARAGRAESHRESDTTGPASPVKLRIHAVQGELGTSQLVTLNEEKQVKYLYFNHLFHLIQLSSYYHFNSNYPIIIISTCIPFKN